MSKVAMAVSTHCGDVPQFNPGPVAQGGEGGVAFSWAGLFRYRREGKPSLVLTIRTARMLIGGKWARNINRINTSEGKE